MRAQPDAACRPRVYLAGPEVFRRDAAAAGMRLKALCDAAGLDGIFPLDPSGDDDTFDRSAGAIRRRCIAGITRADALVANISPFRGPHMDPGTAWEIGYAEALGKPVLLWSADRRPMARRIATRWTATGRRDPDGLLVEDFGLAENLMIAHPGGAVHRSAAQAIGAAAEICAGMCPASRPVTSR